MADDEKPTWMTDEWYHNLCAHWGDPKIIKKSETARKYWLSEPDGPSTCISKHRAGSRSSLARAQDLARERGCSKGEVLYEVTQSIHASSDGQYLTHKARQINERVKEIDADKWTDANMNQIYVDVCGGGLNNKKRMFGTCNLARAMLSQGSSSDGGLRGNVSREAMENEINELRQQLVTEKAELHQQLDVWGFGDESKTWAKELDFSVDLWRDQVHYFIEEVVKKPVYPVGNSLGGFVSIYFAACYPEFVKGVTLLNATPFWGFLHNRERSPRLSRLFPWARTFPLPSSLRKFIEIMWEKISDPRSVTEILLKTKL